MNCSEEFVAPTQRESIAALNALQTWNYVAALIGGYADINEMPDEVTTHVKAAPVAPARDAPAESATATAAPPLAATTTPASTSASAY